MLGGRGLLSVGCGGDARVKVWDVEAMVGVSSLRVPEGVCGLAVDVQRDKVSGSLRWISTASRS